MFPWFWKEASARARTNKFRVMFRQCYTIQQPWPLKLNIALAYYVETSCLHKLCKHWQLLRGTQLMLELSFSVESEHTDCDTYRSKYESTNRNRYSGIECVEHFAIRTSCQRRINYLTRHIQTGLDDPTIGTHFFHLICIHRQCADSWNCSEFSVLF